MLAAIFGGHPANDSLGFRGRYITVGNSRSVREPYIYVGKVLNVRGEEGTTQLCADQDTAGEKHGEHPTKALRCSSA